VISDSSSATLARFFATPVQGLAHHPPAGIKLRRKNKPRIVDFSNLCRSKRQAASRLKHLPMEERASHVLCRRLGYIKDDLTPAEQAIKDFVANFNGPLPQHIIAALSCLFRLDDEDLMKWDNALA